MPESLNYSSKTMGYVKLASFCNFPFSVLASLATPPSEGIGGAYTGTLTRSPQP